MTTTLGWKSGWTEIGDSSALRARPDLDLAWFNQPSKRAMLVSTTVLGEYRGSEDILESNPRYTKINNLRRYAPTRRFSAKVIDGAGRAVSGARLEFQIYNSGEFFPLAKCTTGKEGACSFLTGLGDLLVWAARDNRFGFRKISVKSSAAVTITLEKKPDKEYQLNLDLIPPKEIKSISAGQCAQNQEPSPDCPRRRFESGLRGDFSSLPPKSRMPPKSFVSTRPS